MSVAVQRLAGSHQQDTVFVVADGDDFMLFHKIEGEKIKQALIDLQHVDFDAGHAVVFCQSLQFGGFRHHFLGQQVIPDADI